MSTNPLAAWSNPPSGGGTGGGANQWMTYPALPNFNPMKPESTMSGTPMTTGTGTSWNPGATPFAGQKPGDFGKGMPGGTQNLGASTFTAPTFDPQFTNQYYQYLTQMMGQGAGLQNNLLSFLQGGPSSIPGASQLSHMAETGSPITALPEWQAMLQAQKQNIAQNQAGLKEQFGFAGNLDSSPFGTAMSNYMQQTTADQNALLGQLQTQAMEAAMGRELQAGQGLQAETGNMDQFLQSLFSTGALSSPQIFQKQKSSGLGGLLGGMGSLLSGAGAFGTAASDAGGIGALFAGLI